jgi:long-subunit acyl-CoA synthetase (AMP-forming)
MRQHEKIEDIVIGEEEFTTENGELSSSGKFKRDIIKLRYENEIKRISESHERKLFICFFLFFSFFFFF